MLKRGLIIHMLGVLAIALLPLPLLAAQSEKIVPSRTKEHTGSFASPDGKYRAVLTEGEAEEGFLDLYRNGPSGKPLFHFSDMEGFVWVPRSAHKLVAAASGIYGTAMLVEWNGGRRLHSLRKPPDSDSWFHLDGITADGRTIIYRYVPYDNAPFLRRQRRMILP